MADDITVAITAPGGMGSAIGRTLRQNGAKVRTSLRGRSAASAERAQKAGIAIAETDEELVEGADFVLAILPPGESASIAQRLRGPLERAKKKPVYVDCNAVAPATVRRVAAIVEPSGCAFVDGGIIGPPPSEKNAGRTFLYVSGAHAPDVERLRDFGLTIVRIDGPVGAASAMKMSYGGISKGTVAIGTAMALGAARYGTIDALQQQLSTSHPELGGYLFDGIPKMFPKAYRFVAEMEELAEFLEGIPGAAEMYRGAAVLFKHLGETYGEHNAADGEEFAALKRFSEVKV